MVNCPDRYADKLPGVILSRNLISNDIKLSHQTNDKTAIEVYGKISIDDLFTNFLLRDEIVNMRLTGIELSSDKNNMILNALGIITESLESGKIYGYKETSTFTFRKLADGTSEIFEIKTRVISALIMTHNRFA